MKQYIFVALTLSLFSCTQTIKKQGDLKLSTDDLADSIEVNYCQKEIIYDGMKGVIDSIAINVYTKSNEDELLVSTTLKYYDKLGYIFSDETKIFEDNNLLSVTHTAYSRDENSMITTQLTNYLTTSGDGYTKQYNLVDRGSDKEIWEYLRKMPSEELKLSAEIREYTNERMQILSQVGNTTETSLTSESKYNDKGQLSNNSEYNNDQLLSSSTLEYNDEGFVSKIGSKKDNVSYIEEFEYIYDANRNPFEVKVYKDSEIVSIIKYNIFYNESF